MRLKRKIFGFVMVMIFILSTISIQATVSIRGFNDVEDDHWAYEYIKLMSELNIINGYGDGGFHPDESVSREQFSKMMVLTLKLDLVEPLEPFFEDVNKGDWSYPYVETARLYLTGFRSGSGDYFRPQLNAVREDMAVAIVRGLGLSVSDVNLSLLDSYSDKGQISSNLRPYVAKAIEEGIMIGRDNTFNPQGTLKRAEAATLLARLITDEKVVYDETKVIYDTISSDENSKTTELEVSESKETSVVSESNRTPQLSALIKEGGIKMDWTSTASDSFKYYKVVLSKSDSTPVYPGDGYLAYISNVSDSDYFANAGQYYNGGDIGGKLVSGQTYYISITAVYSDGSKYYPSNTVTIKLP